MNNNINKENINKEVIFIGWIESKKILGKIAFAKLRGYKKYVQLFCKEKSKINKLKEIPIESLIQINGLLQLKKQTKTSDKNLKYEILAKNIVIINESISLPFNVSEVENISENIKYKYRYLWLRNFKLNKKIKIKAKANLFIRNFLDKKNFVDIETPLLASPTYEGSKEYLVPYKRKKSFGIYSLAQSPQIFKQMLMCSGFQKYFQIVKCFRDEDLRSNRQPEFIQLDIEQSFLEENKLFELIQKLIINLLIEVFNISKEKIKFSNLDYNKSISHYGTDAPDTRFENFIVDLSKQDLIKNNNYSYAVSFNNFELNNAIKKEIFDISKKFNNTRIKLVDSLNKNLDYKIVKIIKDKNKSFNENDRFIIIIAENSIKKLAMDCIAKIRFYLGKKLSLYDNSLLNFVWITNWPMFVKNSEGLTETSHHPFTKIKINDENEKINENVGCYAYDLTLNGEEIGSGSIRNHNYKDQELIFNYLKIDKKNIVQNFQFFLDALKYGAPPHGGIAIGLDRLYSLVLKTESIRDFIAFPKAANGSDLMNNKKKFNNEINQIKLLLKK